MGFPSPAKDYLEHNIDLNEIMVSRPAATLFVPTCDGLVLVDKSLKPNVGDLIYFELYGTCQLGRLERNHIACPDGETLEGEVLNDVTVIGVQTWGVISAREDSRPII
ncbi:hypothetical protein EGJ48_03355 [Pantoea dispersa]|uniref:hypothetical protein n=1 Tax=Pantoea dispersa TaxID=59814 RepID=UPI000F66B745|nr:hypothetical protein [Pantoea dispersa]RRW77596.1 hypothetical protein EGJ48_03355 [Pantoea dispersa]